MAAYPPTGANLRSATQLPPPVKVAPIKSSTPNLRRQCAELGVCQGLEPPCGLCAKHQEPDTSTHYSVEPVAYWGAIALLSFLSTGALAGFAGYIRFTFF